MLPSLKIICLQKQFLFFNHLLNMIDFDKSSQMQSSHVWLICGAPKWIIFGLIAVSVQALAAKQYGFAALPLPATARAAAV